ncbi:cell division protein FtsQ/DivIB [Butyrivibrio sp. FCS014]|uniref:cell division protein FtsQ/DivIB n=1 Tax=Butyrivibrio sp. FCS014 TaxID=1408304 RepID=UPI0004666D9A|nr:FtsQ-type POTRA domain-containing protein [Butyrivibrio sp. FCS014]
MAKHRKRTRKRLRKREYSEYRPGIRERLQDFHPLRGFGRSVFLHKSLYIIFGTLIIILIAAAVVLVRISDKYEIKNIYVTGNTHYEDKEIVDMVLSDKLSRNSLYLSFRYRDKSIDNIPFIEKMDVDILSPDTVRINVYEKAIAGYLSYLGRYMYFDREGIVVESSLEASDNVPEVMGLSFDYIIMHEKLPIDNENVFEEILDITQLMDKYELDADKIFFDSDYNVYLYFGDIEVSLGTEDYIDEKIIQLRYILPNLEGKSGILEMKDFDIDTKNVTFEEKSH